MAEVSIANPNATKIQGVPVDSSVNPPTAGKFLGIGSDDSFQLLDPTDLVGASAVLSCPFLFSDAAIAAGDPLEIWTPPAGIILTDVHVSFLVAFDGTTPKADVGFFSSEDTGLFDQIAGAPLDATIAASDNFDGGDSGLLTTPSQASGGSLAVASAKADANLLPAYCSPFAPGAPLSILVSTDGTTTGGPTGSSQGIGLVLLSIATGLPTGPG